MNPSINISLVNVSVTFTKEKFFFKFLDLPNPKYYMIHLRASPNDPQMDAYEYKPLSIVDYYCHYLQFQ